MFCSYNDHSRQAQLFAEIAFLREDVDLTLAKWIARQSFHLTARESQHADVSSRARSESMRT